MSSRMREGLDPGTATKIRDDLLGRHGALKRIGTAWKEDVIAGYRRFRVPVEFEKATIDFRIVFDDEKQVSGFFIVEHVEPPDGPTQEVANSPAAGHWEGTINIPGSPLVIAVDLRLDGGLWSGSCDIPAQAAKQIPLGGIELDGNRLKFSMAGVPGDPTFNGKLADGKITGSFTQSGQSIPFQLGREPVSGPGRPQEPQPPFPYAEEQVSFSNGEIVLAGTLTLPSGSGPFPGVLLVSGSGPQNRNEEVFGHKPFLLIADRLTRAGIAVLRYDDRGVGGSTGDRSAATSEDYALDAAAGVQFLGGRPEIDEKRVGIIGHSEGGTIAPMVATRGDAVAFVVLLAGTGVPGDELLTRQTELISKASGMPEERVERILVEHRKLMEAAKSGASTADLAIQVRSLTQEQMGTASLPVGADEAIRQEAMKIASPWFRFFFSYDPRPALRALDVPVLALNGSLDLQVDPAQNLPEIRLALEAGENSDFIVQELPGSLLFS